MDKLDYDENRAISKEAENDLAVLLKEKATAEVLIYSLIFLFALLIRAAGVGIHPLFAEEAGQAIIGLWLTSPVAAAPATYSPLLATLNWLTFTLFGATEASARLGGVLCGAFITLLPWGLRQVIGRRAALFAALLLAISPTFIFLSRFNSGAVFAAAGLLLILVNWASIFNPNKASNDWPFFVGVVLLFLAAPEGYGYWLVILLFCLLTLLLKKDAEMSRQAKAIVPWSSLHDKKYLSGFVIGLFILATTFFINPAGLGAVVEMPVAWLQRFVPSSEGHQGYFPAAFTLLMSEPFILVAGIFGATMSVLRRKPLQLFLVFSFIVLLLLDIFMPERSLGQAIIVLLPLLLLAAVGLDDFMKSLADEPLKRPMFLLSAVILIIGVYALIGFSEYLKIGGASFWVPVSSAVIIALLAILFSIWYTPAVSLRSLAVVGAAALLIATLSYGVRLNYSSLEKLPYQPLLNSIPAEGMHELEKTVHQISSQKVGDPNLLSMLIVPDSDPLLRWEFRNYPNAIFSPSIVNMDKYGAVIAPATAIINEKVSFSGQPFSWSSNWSPAGLQGQDLLQWLLYRTSPIQPSQIKLVLWIKQS
jgi:4-amino-4-deoxy-L-arabinose transferase-like glycosyltransferase